MAAIDIAGFFEKVWSQVAVAERAAGDVTERWFEIAGRTLHLRLIGSALQKVIVPALSHLEVAACNRGADLTLHTWDCQSLKMEFPQAPVKLEAFTPAILILTDCYGGCDGG